MTATRIYQARVQAMMQEIIKNPSNPLSVEHFASKLEFQARGAGHNHGVLWLDIGKIEQKADVRCITKNVSENDYSNDYLKDPNEVQELNEFLKAADLKPDKRPGYKRKHKAVRYLERLIKIKEHTILSQKHQDDFEKLTSYFPLYGLSFILKKMQKNEEITDEEAEKLCLFVDTFSTVSLHPAIVGPIVAAIAEKVNQHSHTKTCRKYQTTCRFNMPKLPSYETIIARPPGKAFSDQEIKSLETKHSSVIKKVKEVINNKELMKTILEEQTKESETTMNEAVNGKKSKSK